MRNIILLAVACLLVLAVAIPTGSAWAVTKKKQSATAEECWAECIKTNHPSVCKGRCGPNPSSVSRPPASRQ